MYHHFLGDGNGGYSTSSMAQRTSRLVRLPFVGRAWLKAEKELVADGFLRRSPIISLMKILVFMAFLGGMTIYAMQEEIIEISIDKAFTMVLSLGVAIIAYQQWIAVRYEISVDKYYDRLESANKRLEVLPDIEKRDMHAFVELDKLEYVIVKYWLGYISPYLAKRALENFECHCRCLAGFPDLALNLSNESAYLNETRYVVRKICERYPSAPASTTSQQSQMSDGMPVNVIADASAQNQELPSRQGLDPVTANALAVPVASRWPKVVLAGIFLWLALGKK